MQLRLAWHILGFRSFGSCFGYSSSKEGGSEDSEHVSRFGEMRVALNILTGKCEGKRPLGRPSGRWKANITINFRGYRVGGCELDSFGSE
jgi:hypothetical protein